MFYIQVTYTANDKASINAFVDEVVGAIFCSLSKSNITEAEVDKTASKK